MVELEDPWLWWKLVDLPLSYNHIQLMVVAGGEAPDPDATRRNGNVPEQWLHVKLLVSEAVSELPIGFW